jgi:hypothetical protein
MQAVAMAEEVEDELTALRAMYGDDYRELPPVWGMPALELRVLPSFARGASSARGGGTISARVAFTLAGKYPRDPPTIVVSGLEGVDADEGPALQVRAVVWLHAYVRSSHPHYTAGAPHEPQKLLDARALEYKGRTMVHELYMVAQEVGAEGGGGCMHTHTHTHVARARACSSSRNSTRPSSLHTMQCSRGRRVIAAALCGCGTSDECCCYLVCTGGGGGGRGSKETRNYHSRFVCLCAYACERVSEDCV